MSGKLITLLVLAHVGVAFWAFGPGAWMAVPGPGPHDPQRTALQWRPELIVVLGPQTDGAAPSAVPREGPAAALETAARSEVVQSDAAPVAPASAARPPLGASAPGLAGPLRQPLPTVEAVKSHGAQQQPQ